MTNLRDVLDQRHRDLDVGDEHAELEPGNHREAAQTCADCEKQPGDRENDQTGLGHALVATLRKDKMTQKHKRKYVRLLSHYEIADSSAQPF